MVFNVLHKSSLTKSSLQCRRILGGLNLRVRVVVAAIFDDSGRLGRAEIVTLRVGARVKEGKGGGEREKKTLLSPRSL